MSWLAHFLEALRNLLSAKLRSFLAILGILVGTGSVVALISSSQLATEHALAQFKTLGTNLIGITLSSDNDRGGDQAMTKRLELNDALTLAKKISTITNIAPYTFTYQPLHFDDESFQGQTLGATEALAQIAKINLASGRFISFLDQNNFYCVVGSSIAKTIQQRGIDPVGQQIKVGSRMFTIVGVLEPWKPNLFIYADLNNGIIISLPLSLLLNQQTKIGNILVQIKRGEAIETTKKQLTHYLQQHYPELQARFRDPEQIINLVGKQRQTFSLLLGAIGGISLLVGGIGVMNIMLVSVIERRREIGIRMAIGARRKDILSMFLFESLILTAFGGLLGILLGTITTFIIAMSTGWEYTFHPTPPLLGFVVSTLVGILSGFYPALRASVLDPIQSLQSD